VSRETRTSPATHSPAEVELLARAGLAHLEEIVESPREWFVAKRGLVPADFALLTTIVRRHGFEPHPSWGGGA